ncbi:MAG: MIP/aquaporin family protein [Pseudomonadota bacterium]
MPTPFQKLLAEALGTAFLLIGVVGSGIMAETLSQGNTGLALLCNAAATAAILVVIITAFGPISGAHFNPAVTLVFALRSEIDNGLASAYVIVQVVSAILGVWAAHIMFDQPILQLSETARSSNGLWFAEIIATFGLVATILLTLQANANAVAAMVGLYIGGAYFFTASTSFANPAVTIARSLTNTFAGIEPTHVAAYIAMQIIGALLAAFVCAQLILPRATPAIAPSTTSAKTDC